MASNVEIIVTATDQASGTLKKIGGEMQDMGGLGQIAAAGFALAASAIAAAGVAMQQLASAASEAEQVQAKFDALVGSSALANYRGEMERLAATLSQVTRFDDEAILGAEAQLSLYSNIGQDIFPQVISTALDLAEAMGTDATSGAESLGRALADISGGSLSLLQRSRLLTVEQVNTAEAMAKAGDEAGAQAYILDILNGKIGTLAETMGQTFAGQVTILKNKFDNLKEELGAKLLPVLIPVVNKFGELLDKYGPKISAFFDKVLVPGLQSAIDWLMQFTDQLTSGNFNLGEWLLSLDFGAISAKIIEGIKSIDWNAVGNAVGNGIAVMAQLLQNAVQETDWAGLLSAIGSAFLDFATGLFGSNSEALKQMWMGNLMQLVSIVDQVGTLLRGHFLSMVMSLVSTAAFIASQIVNAFRSKFGEFRSVGKYILDGIRIGILGALGNFTSWLEGVVMSIVQGVLDTLGIQSPSKVFANIGKQMMAGMAQGIAFNASMPTATMRAATMGVVGASQTTQNNYYYGRILMQAGQEGQIMNLLLE